MPAQVVNTKELRIRLAAKGILGIAELARMVPCSRQAIYFALERPARFPRVASRINEILSPTKAPKTHD